MKVFAVSTWTFHSLNHPLILQNLWPNSWACTGRVLALVSLYRGAGLYKPLATPLYVHTYKVLLLWMLKLLEVLHIFCSGWISSLKYIVLFCLIITWKKAKFCTQCAVVCCFDEDDPEELLDSHVAILCIFHVIVGGIFFMFNIFQVLKHTHTLNLI